MVVKSKCDQRKVACIVYLAGLLGPTLFVRRHVRGPATTDLDSMLTALLTNLAL